MLDYLKTVFKLKSTRILLIISLFSIVLSGIRVYFTGKPVFTFMIWNLFLAFVPWLLITIIHIKKIRNRLLFGIMILAWLAFFPNAPYVLTDLIHLGNEKSAPLWFDLILLLGYGFGGLMYGFTSLYMMEVRMREKFPPLAVNAISVAMIYLSCFGVYIGRFLRWNSWDLVTNLDAVFRDIYHTANPFRDPTAWLFTILFGTLLTMVYYSYKYLTAVDTTEPRT